MYEIKPFLVVVEGEEDEQFFRWLLWDREKVEVKAVGGKSFQLRAVELFENILSPEKYIIIQDRNFGEFWENVYQKDNLLVKAEKHHHLWMLKFTELENIYFAILKTLDSSKFDEMVSFIKERMDSEIYWIFYARICKSTLFARLREFTQREEIKNCCFSCNLDKKIKEEVEKIIAYIRKDGENALLYLLPMKDVFMFMEKCKKFDYLQYIKKAVGIGEKRLSKEKLGVRERLLKENNIVKNMYREILNVLT